MTAPRISRLTAEHRNEAFGIGTPTPRLSWCTETDAPGWIQSAYELRIDAADGTERSTGVIESRSPYWSTGLPHRWNRVRCARSGCGSSGTTGPSRRGAIP